MDKSYEAYQGLLKTVDRKFYGWYVAYADGKIVCLTDNLEHLKSVRFIESDRVVYFEIGKNKMYEL